MFQNVFFGFLMLLNCFTFLHMGFNPFLSQQLQQKGDPGDGPSVQLVKSVSQSQRNQNHGSQTEGADCTAGAAILPDGGREQRVWPLKVGCG